MIDSLIYVSIYQSLSNHYKITYQSFIYRLINQIIAGGLNQKFMADSPIEAGLNFADLLPDHFSIDDDTEIDNIGHEVTVSSIKACCRINCVIQKLRSRYHKMVARATKIEIAINSVKK